MPEWSTSKSITEGLKLKWDKGYMLSHAITKDDFFPFKMKLKGPSSDEINIYFSEMIDWISELKSHAKPVVGYGYEIVEKTIHHRLSGKNTIPAYIIIPTLHDAVKLIKKQAELDLFLKNADKLTGKWPVLEAWVTKYPFKVINIGNSCDGILKVLDWFSIHNEKPYLYLRQLDIEGVDTKFIELNKGVISDLLNFILPDNKINRNSTIFEDRFYLKRKSNLVRFRISEHFDTINGFTDMTVPLNEFAQWNSTIPRFFFTENEINFLSFPLVENACVVFGKGYGVELFHSVPWLKDKEIYYWGDIDTHGFNILSLARHFLPQIQSFLMSEEVLLAHRSLWVNEDKPFLSRIDRLNAEEYSLVCKLQCNYWGKGVRLEQERIKFSYVNRFLKSLK